MKRVIIAQWLMVVAMSAGTLSAAETTVHGRLYSHWAYDMTAGRDDMNDFGLSRAYVTVRSKLSDYTSIRITSDLRESKIEDDGAEIARYYVIIKYGYLEWQPAFGRKLLKLRFGLQPTPYLAYQNKAWGRRYLSKTVGDIQGFLTTSDAGVSAHYALGEKGTLGSVTMAVFNGTSYSSLGEANKQKDLNFFARLNPLTGVGDFSKSAVVAQYYKGTQNVVFDNTTLSGDYAKDIVSIGGLLVFRGIFRLGADLNWLTLGMGAGIDDLKETGLSFHGTLFLAELVTEAPALRTLNIFWRYDAYDPNTDAASDNDTETHLIVGVECNPTRGLKASVNFRSTNFDDDTLVSERHLFVNTLFKF